MALAHTLYLKKIIKWIFVMYLFLPIKLKDPGQNFLNLNRTAENKMVPKVSADNYDKHYC